MPEKKSTRRKALQIGAAALSAGSIVGTAGASGEKAPTGLNERPALESEYNRYLKGGELEKAHSLLQEAGISSGFKETQLDGGSQTTDKDGKVATVQDVYDEGDSSVSLSYAYRGLEEHGGQELHAFDAGLFIDLDRDGRVGPAGNETNDVGAITLEDTHLLGRPTDFEWGETPRSMGQGSLEDYRIKSEGVYAEVDTPPRQGTGGNGYYQHYINTKLLMHPSAQEVSQIYGHYTHTWERSGMFGGSVDSININYGVLSVGTSLGANDWTINVDPVLIYPD